MGRSATGRLSYQRETTMKDNIIYLEGSRRMFTARELLDVLQLGWTPDAQLSLADLCHAAEQWADSTSFDEDETDDE
jgi:hypothetical protein